MIIRIVNVDYVVVVTNYYWMTIIIIVIIIVAIDFFTSLPLSVL